MLWHSPVFVNQARSMSGKLHTHKLCLGMLVPWQMCPLDLFQICAVIEPQLR